MVRIMYKEVYEHLSWTGFFSIISSLILNRGWA